MTSTAQIVIKNEIKEEIFDDDYSTAMGNDGEIRDDMDDGDCPLTLNESISSIDYPNSGPVELTDEERKTLTMEGFTIPKSHPLTPREREALKIVRRKIKNKISAQESRRKRKEYLEQLEGRQEKMEKEIKRLNGKNETLTKRIVLLEKFIFDLNPDYLESLS